MEKDTTPAPKVKRSNKPILIALAIFLVIITISSATFYFLNKDPAQEEAQKILKENFESMKKAELPPSALDPSLLTEINQLIIQQKYTEAKTKLDQITSQSNLTQGDSLIVNSSLSNVCVQIADFECIDKVIQFNESQNKIDVYLPVAAARKADSVGNKELSVKYYKKALDIVNANGGEEFITKLNTNSEGTLSLQELQGGSTQ